MGETESVKGLVVQTTPRARTRIDCRGLRHRHRRTSIETLDEDVLVVDHAILGSGYGEDLSAVLASRSRS
jgi:hypothetical protein